MRSVWRTVGREIGADAALVAAAVGVVGLAFGAIAVGSGQPLWLPIALSVLVFAGASQFVFIGILAAGGGPLGALVAALAVNSRHLPFGFAVSDALGSGWRRYVGAHLMIDETVAFTIAQQDPGRRRAVYWTLGVGLFVTWNIGVLAGSLAGTAAGDTAALGLDAAFPAMLLALVRPSLRERRMAIAAALGACVAVASTPVLPSGMPVLAALLVLLAVPAGTPRAAVPGVAGESR
ncbi:AzlC family ABC transporter permease [Haloechinothrix sp. YIM 98757]|uniref:AzlC family ABC transporter permease n=1 Tax=Haloechinothrix aidingensis TaxID=2752311 RepID=A0A838A3Z4_9PSEU|nr:AzlC family ABC transporter permease [Haloechinothrix aidingensis]MBA0126033.1 AzlC family ABC transporter permease [Haloechinothrix aidingensis]